MPKIGNKKFKYDKKGIAKYKQALKKLKKKRAIEEVDIPGNQYNG
jgi:hypothetical protein